MIGKIILAIYLIGNAFLYIKKWNTENPIRIIGFNMLLADLLDIAIICSVFFWW